MLPVSTMNNIVQIKISIEYCLINSWFSQAKYQTDISNRFHNNAQSHVYKKNLAKFILKTHAGRLINCLTTDTNLAKNVVILQWFLK